ncbi:hypothetical protein pb186bvf_013997 [Paramecium bursaria]
MNNFYSKSQILNYNHVNLKSMIVICLSQPFLSYQRVFHVKKVLQNRIDYFHVIQYILVEFLDF